MPRILRIHSRQEGKLIVIVIILLLIFFILSVLLYLIIVGNLANQQKSNETDVCISETCVKVANFLLNLSNSSEACEDLASDICPVWNHTRPTFIPNVEKTQLTLDKEIREMLETVNKNSIRSRSSRNLLTFYRNCKVFDKLDEGHLYWLRTFLRDLGGWPLIEEQWDGLYFDWIYSIGKAANMAGISLLISVSTQLDENNSQKNILKIKKPENSIDISSINYFKAVKELAISVGANDNIQLQTQIGRIKLVDRIINYPKTDNQSEKLTLRELHSLLPSINWIKLVHVITNSTFKYSNISINDDEIVMLEDKEYFINMNEMLLNRTFSKRILANYIGANSAVNLLRWFYKPFQIQEFFLDQPTRINGFGSISSFYCIQFLKNTMNYAFDHLLAVYSHLKLNEGEEMNGYLMKAMKYIISKMENLPSSDKQALTLKLNDLIIINNAPDWIFKQDFIDELYNQIPELNFNILESIIKLSSNSLMSSFRNLRSINTRDNWPPTVSLSDNEIVYNPHLNSLIIPAFMTHYPLYKSNYPNLMNFAAVGTIFGNKFIKEFFKFNINKIASDSDENTMENKEKEQEFSKEYNSLNVLSTSYHFPEFVDDNSGIKLAFLAYKLWELEHGEEKKLPGINYSKEELFIIFHQLMWCSSEQYSR
ncbi:endothelin-converting enzyme 1-like [Centruroides vittatus]|uniref:endothelin-converting enzyme 1-like n=1 Tax=Centruroides vittatus TaxID=120091 RepID=UPI00350EC66D